jgi:hemerythrin-like domain-containing protein
MESITTTNQARPTFLNGFAAMHEAMRRDADRLPRATATMRTARDAAALVRWYDLFRESIEHHHQRGDDLIWPELLRRDPSFAVEHARLVEDHHALDIALAVVTTALADRATGVVTTNDVATSAAAALGELLVDHLAREEAAAFGRLAVEFTAEEYEVLERQIIKGTRVSALAFQVPWVLDEMSEEEYAAMREQAPILMRVLHRVVFARRYAKVAAPLLAVGR